jgi:hypothetical protein
VEEEDSATKPTEQMPVFLLPDMDLDEDGAEVVLGVMGQVGDLDKVLVQQDAQVQRSCALLPRQMSWNNSPGRLKILKKICK